MKVCELKQIIEGIPDDFDVHIQTLERLSDKELEKMNYPYPFHMERYEDVEYGDTGYSDKVIRFDIRIN